MSLSAKLTASMMKKKKQLFNEEKTDVNRYFAMHYNMTNISAVIFCHLFNSISIKWWLHLLQQAEWTKRTRL